MKLSTAISGFKISCLADGYAQVTLAGYVAALGHLSRYLEDPEINEITTEHLKSFMLYLRTVYKPHRKGNVDSPLSTASHHRYWKSMRCFFKWSAAEKYTERPDESIKMPRYTTREILPFSEEDIKRMLKACENRAVAITSNRAPYQCSRPPYIVLRDRAMILVLLDTGVRSGEFSRLRIQDADLETGAINILPYHVGKTRPRTVYLGKGSKKALWKYLQMRDHPAPGDSLFLNMENHAMCQESVKSVLYIVARNAKVANCHPHRFRHTFAIQYLRNGGDVFTLQKILGHATLTMVSHYLSIASTDTIDAHRKSSPVDRWQL